MGIHEAESAFNRVERAGGEALLVEELGAAHNVTFSRGIGEGGLAVLFSAGFPRILLNDTSR